MDESDAAAPRVNTPAEGPESDATMAYGTGLLYDLYDATPSIYDLDPALFSYDDTYSSVISGDSAPSFITAMTGDRGESSGPIAEVSTLIESAPPLHMDSRGGAASQTGSSSPARAADLRPLRRSGRTSEAGKRFECQYTDCGRVFYRKTSLTNHTKAHQNKNSRSIMRSRRQRAAAIAKQRELNVASQRAAMHAVAMHEKAKRGATAATTTTSQSPGRSTRSLHVLGRSETSPVDAVDVGGFGLNGAGVFLPPYDSSVVGIPELPDYNMWQGEDLSYAVPNEREIATDLQEMIARISNPYNRAQETELPPPPLFTAPIDAFPNSEFHSILPPPLPVLTIPPLSSVQRTVGTSQLMPALDASPVSGAMVPVHLPPNGLMSSIEETGAHGPMSPASPASGGRSAGGVDLLSAIGSGVMGTIMSPAVSSELPAISLSPNRSITHTMRSPSMVDSPTNSPSRAPPSPGGN